MNHKASGRCSNGHAFQWGTCKTQVSKLFGGTKTCGSKGFEQIYGDGSTLTASFGDTPFIAVRCVGCRTEVKSTTCPECGIAVPVSAFKKEGFLAKLG